MKKLFTFLLLLTATWACPQQASAASTDKYYVRTQQTVNGSTSDKVRNIEMVYNNATDFYELTLNTSTSDEEIDFVIYHTSGYNNYIGARTQDEPLTVGSTLSQYYCERSYYEYNSKKWKLSTSPETYGTVTIMYAPNAYNKCLRIVSGERPTNQTIENPTQTAEIFPKSKVIWAPQYNERVLLPLTVKIDGDDEEKAYQFQVIFDGSLYEGYSKPIYYQHKEGSELVTNNFLMDLVLNQVSQKFHTYRSITWRAPHDPSDIASALDGQKEYPNDEGGFKTGLESTENKKIKVRVRPVDPTTLEAKGNWAMETYIFNNEALHLSANDYSGFYINQKKVTINKELYPVEESFGNTFDGDLPDVESIPVYYALLDDPETQYIFYSETMSHPGDENAIQGQPLPADGVIIFSTDKPKHLVLTANPAQNKLPDPKDQTVFDMGEYGFTFSTSENYLNYYYNKKVDGHATHTMCDDYYDAIHDDTWRLDPTWGSNSGLSVDNEVTSWNGRSGEKELRKVAGGTTLEQTVDADDYTGWYVVQAIVSGEDGKPITLSLNDGAQGDVNEVKAYLTQDPATASLLVNKYGRVERYFTQSDKAELLTLDGYSDDQLPLEGRKWFKMETVAKVDASHKIKIGLHSDADFYLADVTLLPTLFPYEREGYTLPSYDGDYIAGGGSDPIDDSYYITTSITNFDITWDSFLPIDDEDSDILDPESIPVVPDTDLDIGPIEPDWIIKVPGINNGFSFYDRGENLNSVIYANQMTVIGGAYNLSYDEDSFLPEGIEPPLSSWEEHRTHPFNVVTAGVLLAKDINGEDLYYYSSPTVSWLVLTDTDGTEWENKHTFGIPNKFNAYQFYYDRNLAKGQRSTCMLPFTQTFDHFPAAFGTSWEDQDYWIALFDGVDEETGKLKLKTGKLEFHELENYFDLVGVQEIPANTPFVYCSTKDGVMYGINDGGEAIAQYVTIEPIDPFAPNKDHLYSVLYNDNEDPSSASIWFRGVYQYVDDLGQQDDCTAYLYSPAKDYFGQASAHADAKPFRGIVEVKKDEGAMAAKFLGIDYTGSETTGIDNAIIVSEKAETIYDLQGRRQNGSRLAKGVYVVNGKKRIIK